MTETESVVQIQLEAYNRHDMAGFVATYDPGIRIYELPMTPARILHAMGVI